jgi:hypothetical protein
LVPDDAASGAEGAGAPAGAGVGAAEAAGGDAVNFWQNEPKFPTVQVFPAARAICPERANSGLWEQALIIGECASVLGCVQAERIALIEQLLGGTTARISDAEGAGRAELGASQCKPAPVRDELEAMGLAARDLNRLERYERRALSRRKRAIETFMAINHMP